MSLRSLSAVVLFALACHPRGDVPGAIPPPPPHGSGSPVADADEDAGDEDEDVEIPDVGGDATIAAIVRLGVTDNHVGDHVRHLTETIGPRLTGSHRLMDAERWCRDQFASWGLSAQLERWGEVAVGFDRGPWSGGMVAPESIAYDFTTPAWTPGAFGPVRGRAIAYPTSAKDAKKRKAVFKDAWVVMPADGIDRKLADAIDVVLAEAEAAGVIRADRSGEKNLVHTGGEVPTWNELPKLVRIVLRADQHADLVSRVSAGQAVELSFSIDNSVFRGPVPQHNVVADLVGASKPDEYVIVGGHLDSWDGAQGANDNATGVATTMEAARLLAAAGAKPARTIRFMLWSGEEQGLLGSKGWVDAHGEDMDKISAVLVHDGGTNYLSGIGVTPEMRPQMEIVFAPIVKLAPDTMPFVLRETEALQPGGSDHSPFINAGVPGFFWDQDGESDYERVHHTQHDTLANVVDAYQRHSAMVVAIAAYNLANLPERLDRTNSAPLPRRRVQADFGPGLVVTEVEKGGIAAKAGWKVGDKVVSVEGQTPDNRWTMLRELQKGEPNKTVVIERGGKPITTTLDWSEDPGEAERRARRQQRAQ